MDIWLEPAAKAVLYASVLAAIGAQATRWLLLPRLEGSISLSVRVACENWLAHMLQVSAAAVFAALLLRALAHSVVVVGLSDALSSDALLTVVVASRWGRGWQAQAAASTLVLVAALGTKVHRQAGWILSGFSTLALVGSLPLLGHAAGRPFATLVHGTHVLAAGLWVGTLVIAATVPVFDGVPLRSRMLRAFAPVAATVAGVLLISGAIATWTYLGPTANLWRTDYGRILTLKLSVAAGVACCGFVNWRRLRRPSNWHASRWTLAAEICLAAAVVMLTAWLSETGHPT